MEAKGPLENLNCGLILLLADIARAQVQAEIFFLGRAFEGHGKIAFGFRVPLERQLDFPSQIRTCHFFRG